METTEMTQLVFYTSILVCAALAVYFLRGFLNNRRLRASLWWATGFSLFAFGVLAMLVTTVYGFHRILVVLTFALVAASVAFLYYAASTLFFSRKSFFRERFAVILFAVSVFLFLFPVYLSEGYTAEIIGSSMMALFAVAFLVVTVLFNRVAVLFDKVARKLPKEYLCRRLGILQPLVWIGAVLGLYIALFNGSVMVAGLLFTLISFEFALFWYHCKGGENMIEKIEIKELNIRSIDGLEYKVKRKADSIQVRLHDAMQKIGFALLHAMEAVDESSRRLHQEDDQVEPEVLEIYGEDKRKTKMVTYASSIGIREDELVAHIVELMENTFELAKSAYKNSNPYPSDDPDFPKTDGNGPPPITPEIGNYFPPPLASYCTYATGDLEDAPEATSGEIKRLATMAFHKSSTDKDMIATCCELVRDVCDLENIAVTKVEWEGLPNEQHPGGMIGHTYNILLAYDDETRKTEYAEDFRKRFQEEADERLEEAKELKEKADALIKRLQNTKKQEKPQSSGEKTTLGQAEQAIECLNEAVVLLQNASLLIRDASGFVGNRQNPPRS